MDWFQAAAVAKAAYWLVVATTFAALLYRLWCYAALKRIVWYLWVMLLVAMPGLALALSRLPDGATTNPWDSAPYASVLLLPVAWVLVVREMLAVRDCPRPVECETASLQLLGALLASSGTVVVLAIDRMLTVVRFAKNRDYYEAINFVLITLLVVTVVAVLWGVASAISGYRKLPARPQAPAAPKPKSRLPWWWYLQHVATMHGAPFVDYDYRKAYEPPNDPH